jgi:hypothetical protein
METLLESILERYFQLFRRIHNGQQHNKNAVRSMLIAVEGTGKVSWSWVRGVWEMLHCCHIYIFWGG